MPRPVERPQHQPKAGADRKFENGIKGKDNLCAIAKFPEARLGIDLAAAYGTAESIGRRCPFRRNLLICLRPVGHHHAVTGSRKAEKEIVVLAA